MYGYDTKGVRHFAAMALVAKGVKGIGVERLPRLSNAWPQRKKAGAQTHKNRGRTCLPVRLQKGKYTANT